MNWDQIEGSWKSLKGHARTTWGKLTDDDLEQIAGKRDQFVGALQKRYGQTKDDAERHADAFADRLKADLHDVR
jgi:uncharacterized protein YjbJ (UPF0337 family)